MKWPLWNFILKYLTQKSSTGDKRRNISSGEKKSKQRTYKPSIQPPIYHAYVWI